ncbi:regulatory protein RecX [Glaciecola petra]|uniref:Regulatory protein RecX n=1 Tax=Glaciecola petra TaxID=3075602 RepID=A0ABU2ZN57_9ALTE|nr:regulatory protein RecX [Aestuariibacter sp. P117]MDT0593840.1 regulatory protein RecX [Aestuariibacter sp. P117]
MDQEQIKEINNVITRFLARREYSAFELKQKLAQRGFDAKNVDKQLDLFIQKKLQSDRRYAQSVVRIGYMNGKGPRYIEQKLKQQQIDESLYQSYMFSEEFDWFAKASEVRLKKYGDIQVIDFKVKQKQMRFLQSRGFDLEQIKEAFT